jgi:hypothetical protein
MVVENWLVNDRCSRLMARDFSIGHAAVFGITY